MSHVSNIVRHYQDRCDTPQELRAAIERHARLLSVLDPTVSKALLIAPLRARKRSPHLRAAKPTYYRRGP